MARTTGIPGVVLVALMCLGLPLPLYGNPDYSKNPVLMIHGYFLGAVPTWAWMENRLREAGWPSEYLYKIEFQSGVGCNPSHGHEIAGMVQLIRMQTGRDKIDLLAHSMGALDARYYIKFLCGYRYVENVVMIAGANRGTMTACLDLITCGAKQMCVGPGDNAWKNNPFLLELNSCDMTPGDQVRYTSIWTPFDEIINPSSNSILDGARNIRLNSLLEHATILLSQETLGHVIEGLNGGGWNNNIPEGPEPCHVDCSPPAWMDPGPEPVLEYVEIVEQPDGGVFQEVIEDTDPIHFHEIIEEARHTRTETTREHRTVPPEHPDEKDGTVPPEHLQPDRYGNGPAPSPEDEELYSIRLPRASGCSPPLSGIPLRGGFAGFFLVFAGLWVALRKRQGSRRVHLRGLVCRKERTGQ